MTEHERAVETAPIQQALDAFGRGDPVLIHDEDDREDETDFVYPAAAVGAEDVATLRNDAGGLICVTLSASVAGAFNLPFLADALDHPVASDDDVAYDDRSAFSLTVNHQNTRTGIPDRDRALTIAELGTAADDPASVTFHERFRCPGHVHILKAAAGGLDSRRGHTELSLSLAKAAGRAPATVVCEMLDDDTGKALDGDAAQRYARAESIPFVEGRALIRGLR